MLNESIDLLLHNKASNYISNNKPKDYEIVKEKNKCIKMLKVLIAALVFIELWAV